MSRALKLENGLRNHVRNVAEIKYGFAKLFVIFLLLALPVPIPDEEKNQVKFFSFALLFGASKGFMKAFKAFIKPFEVPQRSAKIKT